MQTVWLPEDAEYGYDVRVQPRLNRMLTSSFTGWNNYMMDFGKLLADPEAMKHFGNTMVVWDFHARKPIQTLEVPGAPLEIRWALQPRHNYAFTSTALTSKLWLIEQQPDGTFKPRARSPTSAIRRRRRCRSTSASRPTTAGCSSTPSWTARCASSTSPIPHHPKEVATSRRSASR